MKFGVNVRDSKTTAKKAAAQSVKSLKLKKRVRKALSLSKDADSAARRKSAPPPTPSVRVKTSDKLADVKLESFVAIRFR